MLMSCPIQIGTNLCQRNLGTCGWLWVAPIESLDLALEATERNALSQIVGSANSEHWKEGSNFYNDTSQGILNPVKSVPLGILEPYTALLPVTKRAARNL